MGNKIKIPFARPFMPLLERESSYRIIVYHGGRGGGKSVHFALALLAKGRLDRYRFLCTREIQKTIRDSVHKVLSDLIHEHEITDYVIKNDSIINMVTGSEFIFKGLHNNYNEIKSTEGIDICWIEEAFSVSMESLNILQPTIRKEGSQLWYSFNRFMDNDPVWLKYCRNPRDGTLIKKVNYYDNPFFPEVLKADMEKDKESDYQTYLHIWEGEPLGQSAESIIPRHNVVRAMNNKTDCAEGAEIVGADIARFGDDKIVFVKRKGLKAIGWKISQKQKLTKTAYDLMDFAGSKDVQCNVDDTGMGGGVTDILSDNGQVVVPVNNGSNAKEKDKYANAISEMWFEFRDTIDENEVDLTKIADEELKDELTSRLYTYDKKGRKIVEDKKIFKKRIGRSPDKSDAVLLSYYNTYYEPMELMSI